MCYFVTLGKSLKHDFIRFVSATMVSQVVFSLYSMVDGLMVSIGVNEYAMSAVNLAIPFTNALFSIAVLFAVGSSTLIAIFIAQEKRHEADTLFSQNFVTLLILGAVITALVLLFLEPFARLLGAGGHARLCQALPSRHRAVQRVLSRVLQP